MRKSKVQGFAKSASSSEALSKIMQDKLNGSPDLQAKQGRLLKQIRSGAKPELLDILTGLLKPSAPEQQQEVMADQVARARARRKDRKSR